MAFCSYTDFRNSGTSTMTHEETLQTIAGFKRKVEFSLETDRFLVHTIDSPADLETILRLRYDIFYREIAQNDSGDGIDIDDFDLISDHLAAVDKSTGRIVATYRLNSSVYSNRFYAQTEFSMDSILSAPGIKLETGRACVHPDFRKGSLVILLWRAIIEYMKKIDARFLFGCSSVSTIDPVALREINHLFEITYASAPEFRVTPHSELALDSLDISDISPVNDPHKRLAELVPPLFMGYLDAMSCRVCGAPALDRFFHLADFLILLDRENIQEKTRRRYGL